MAQQCGCPQEWAREEHRLQAEIWDLLAPEQHSLLTYSNTLARSRQEEERTVFLRVIHLQRHHKDIRSKLAAGSNPSKAVSLLIKAFRLTRDIEQAEYHSLLRAEFALGPLPTLPFSQVPAPKPERPLRLALTQRVEKPAKGRFSRAAAYMRARRIETLS